MNKKSILFAAICHFFCDLNAGALPAVLPYLREAYGFSYSMTSGLMFANSSFSSVLQPLFGYVSDRRPRLWYMALGVLIAGVSMAAVGLLTNFWGIFFAVFLSGVGAAIFHPSGVRFVNKIAGSSQGKGVSFFAVGGNAGFLFAPLIAVALVTLFGLKGLILLAPLVGGIAFFAFRETRKLDAPNGVARKKEAPQGKAENDWHSFSRLILCVISRSTLLISTRTFIPFYWISRFSQSAEQGALALTLFGGFGIAGNIVGGILADRFGYLGMVRMTNLCLIPIVVAFPFVDNFLLANLLLATLGFVLFLPYSSQLVLSHRYLSRNVGFSTGITLGLGMSFGGILAPVMGKAADLWGLSVIFHLLSICAVISTAAAFSLKAPPEPPKLEEA